MGEEKPRRLSLMERSSRPDVPKFRVPSPANPPPAPPKKRVSFNSAQDIIHVYEVEREPAESSLPGVWFSSLTPPKPVDVKPEAEVPSSDQLPAAPSTSSDGPKRKSRLFENPTPIKEKPSEASSGSERVAEHGQDLDEEWSRISVAAQKKVHAAARKRSSRASMRRPSAIGDQLVPSVFLSAESPPIMSAAAVAAASVAKPKKAKKKKKKKKKKRKKKQKKMSVMAFLRGSIKRGSKAKVERALKRMMRRIAKRVKKKHDKMVADQNVDMAKVRKAVRRGRKKKQLYTVKRIRGRKIGLKSLLKQWKWVFIFS